MKTIIALALLFSTSTVYASSSELVCTITDKNKDGAPDVQVVAELSTDNKIVSVNYGIDTWLNDAADVAGEALALKTYSAELKREVPVLVLRVDIDGQISKVSLIASASDMDQSGYVYEYVGSLYMAGSGEYPVTCSSRYLGKE